MHRDLGWLIRSDDREECIDKKAAGPLVRISCGLTDEFQTVPTLPISGNRLKVEGDDAAATHRALRGVVKDNYRSGGQRPARINHVAQTIEMAFHGEELLGAYLWGYAKRVSRSPFELRILWHRHFVGVAEIDDARVGVN